MSTESSDEERPQMLTITKGFTLIQPGDHPVFKVEASELSSFTQLQPQEYVAVKIFDPKTAWENHPFYSSMGCSNDQELIDRQLPMLNWLYNNECKFIRDLRRVPEFNNCYLDHQQLWATVETANGPVSGKCILSRFIETVPLPKTEETRDRVVQQIKVLHKRKIVHNGITEWNILYTKEGEVYLVYFELAIYDPEDHDEYEKDFRALNLIFS